MLRFALAASLLSTAMVATTAAPLDAQTAKQIDADIQSVMRQGGIPSAVIEIVQGGQVVYRQAYGYRDLKGKIPADVNTYYEIASITKQFTAAAILQFQDTGKLNVDDKLSKYLPKAPHADEVTLRQLLAHTSGMPEYFDGSDIEVAATKPITFDQIMARIAGKPLLFEPGSNWSYCDTGYIMLGRVIELISHESYHHYVQTHLLDKAGMDKTFTMAQETRLKDMALPYHRVGGKTEPDHPVSESFAGAAGDLVTTLAELEKWNEALTSGKIVSPADYALMTTSNMTTKHGDSGYGMGLFIDSYDDQPRIGHTGGSLGFTTANEYFPKQDTRVIAFTNLVDDPEPGEKLTRVIFEDIYPDIAAAAARPTPGEDPAMTASAKTFFAEMQSGTEDYSRMGDRLGGKFKGGLAKTLAGEFGPYGAPMAFIFRGHRLEPSLNWYDYLIKFGPGSSLTLSIGLDDSGKIASLSFE